MAISSHNIAQNKVPYFQNRLSGQYIDGLPEWPFSGQIIEPYFFRMGFRSQKLLSLHKQSGQKVSDGRPTPDTMVFDPLGICNLFDQLMWQNPP